MKTEILNSQVCRRKFLSASAMSMLGYSLMVSLPQDAKALESAAKSELGRDIERKTRGKKIDMSAEPNMSKEEIECDVMVAGGGMAGICAAIAAARNGSKVVLIQDRSRLGGNASSEIKMHPLGINGEKWGWREAGILEELKLENAAKNPQRSWEVWDLMLYDKCISEPNLTLILDTTIYSAETEKGKITAAYARCDRTLKIYKIKSKIYIDCTGDARLAMEAGATLMSGREGSKKYGESLADTYTLGGHLCSSIMFTSKDTGKPVKFTPPSWAKKITAEDLKFRDPAKWGFEYGYWFISHGGLADTIRDNEVLRFELLSIVLGVWDYIKNSGKYPDVENRALDFIGMLPGKRDSYRIEGAHIFTQHDIEGGWQNMADQVAAVGWPMEDQPSEGFYARGKKPAIYGGKVPFYNLPLSSLYSKDFSNLMMAGRCMSSSHIAFTSTRVMNVSACAGQAVGTAAALCAEGGFFPKDITASKEKVSQLQQTLLRDGHIILNVKNEDKLDLALKATATASESTVDSRPENVLSGVIFDHIKKCDNRWKAPIANKPILKLEWDKPQQISKIILNVDTGHRLLTQSVETVLVNRIIQAPQPESLKAYRIIAVLADNKEQVVASVDENYQKRIVHTFEKVNAKAIKIECLETNGSEVASIFEVRAYA